MELANIASIKIGGNAVESIKKNGSYLWKKKSGFDGYLLGGDKNVKSFIRAGIQYYWITNTSLNSPHAIGYSNNRFNFAGSGNDYKTADSFVNVLDSYPMNFQKATDTDSTYRNLPTFFLSYPINLSRVSKIHLKHSGYPDSYCYDSKSFMIYLKFTDSAVPMNNVNFSVWNRRHYADQNSSESVFDVSDVIDAGTDKYCWLSLSGQSWNAEKPLSISDIWIEPKTGYDLDGEPETV